MRVDVIIPCHNAARYIADKLGGLLGQRVVVENKPAAAGMVATRDALAQPKDGYTLLLCTHFESINTAVYKNVGFKLSELAPISLVAKYYYGLALANAIPATDLASSRSRRAMSISSRSFVTFSSSLVSRSGACNSRNAPRIFSGAF